MSDTTATLIYLDTNVYARPFDDQTQSRIQEEADAFLEIIEAVRANRIKLLCSDILDFEVHNILREEKRSKVKGYLGLCENQIASSADLLALARNIHIRCQIRPRDAIHVATAILGEARYFLSCDTKITEMKRARCYRRLARSHRTQYFSAMNPIIFVEKMRKGEIE